MRRSSNGLGARSHKDLERSSLLGPIPLGHNTPTSFRLSKEEDLERPSAIPDAPRELDAIHGVQSLQDPASESRCLEQNKDEGESEIEENVHSRRRSTLRPIPEPYAGDDSPVNPGESAANTINSSPSCPLQEDPSPPSMSQSMTSLSLDSQFPLSSLPSTPKSTSNRSFRPSDEESMDEGASQAIGSSEDEEVEPPPEVQDSAPQLIMPSIKMPSRRPFTERGKTMGRLKVLFAGDSGVGKTSLIKSIVQTCEDIVHVDPLSPTSPSISHPTSRKVKGNRDSLNPTATQQILEVYASTRPYPSWWSDIEDTKILRRRKSMGDTILERNVCFVDTPGYSNSISKMESMQSVLQYMEAQLSKPFSALTASEGDIAGLLSGSGGSQVDVVFYLIAQDLKEEDVNFLQRLAMITNVIPVIAQSDTKSFEEIEMLRRSIDKLQDAEIGLFAFKVNRSTLSYTVCSTPADDTDTMDASTLMSPEYVQPLIPSELVNLVDQVFDPDNSACLRHLAARKLVHAQGSQIFSLSTTTTAQPKPNIRSPSPTLLPSLSNASRTMIPYPNRVSQYTQAKITDHTQQQERLAQIRLAKWAGDLQRSLQNERARYEAIARGERAVWLRQKLVENSTNDALICTRDSVTAGPSTEAGLPRAGRMTAHRGLADAGDPLGLLKWNDAMKRRGWIAIQILGSVGVLGAMAVWVARTWSSDSYTSWHWDWIVMR